MVLLGLVVLIAVATVSLYQYLARRPNPRAMWQSTVTIGIVVGIARGVLAGLGWYIVERTGGPLQTIKARTVTADRTYVREVERM